MKSHTITNLVSRSLLALALAVAFSTVQAQSSAPAKGKMETGMMAGCQEMMKQKQVMKEDMAAQDAQLTEQLAKMNRAPEDRKMGLMADAVTHMVEQRIAMDARKSKMEDEMMQHMMQHMQTGKESSSQCPMMKGMKAMDKTPAGAHKDHQEHQK